jgi:hypothetical protein
MRSILARHNDIISKLAARLATIQREGEGRPHWVIQERAAAIDGAKSASRDMAIELKLMAATQTTEARDNFNKAWRGLNHRTLKHTPSERLLWQQLAATTFNGRTPEQAFELYERLVNRMAPEERILYRHIPDEFLELAVYGEPANEFKASQVIDKYRTPEEREARLVLLKAERFEDFVPTLTAIFATNLKEAEDGDKQANDPLNALDNIEQNVAAEFAQV